MEINFLTALIPEPAWCLGVRLRPFSIGHLVLLRRVKSPFVGCQIEGDAAYRQRQWKRIHDDFGLDPLGCLILAVILCADTFAAGVEYLGSRSDRADADQETLKEWGTKCAKLDLNEELAAFLAYKSAADKMPEFFHSSGNQAQAIGAPFWMVIYLTLHKDTNLTDAEIWNQPLGKTYCDYIALREQEQVLRLKTEEDAEVERTAREYYERQKAKG
jgi:hypothetical protein